MPQNNSDDTTSSERSASRFRIESGHSLPGLDDGWAVYRATDDGDERDVDEELLAVLATETLANAVIELLSDDAQKPFA